MKKLACSLAILTLSACAGTSFNWEAARQIKAGMNEHEVATIMGQPYLVRSGPRDGKVIEAPPIPASFK